MFITDKKELKKYESKHRKWQGIPSIEVTKNGRIFSTFYSGGITEEIGNYVVLLKSDDGVNFSEPIAVAYMEDHRCYDPTLWIDPLGRLWLMWGLMPDHALYGVICDDPDAKELVWGKEFVIGYDVMMNRPTVLSSGEWLFPIAVWDKNIGIGKLPRSQQSESGAFVYVTKDCGKTFEKLGGTVVEKRVFDEHMTLELKDGRLMMLVRTAYGIGVSYSEDKGKTWSKGEDSGIGGPCSRFHIKRLKSGRVLLVNHYNFRGRNNMTAMLSDDDCKTWKYKLLIDERNLVSYPDAVEAEDGFIYITYDRERGAFYSTWDNSVKDHAREILMAKITEEDIIQGKLVNPESKLKCIISKLTSTFGFEYIPEEPNRLSDIDLAHLLLAKYPDDIVSKIFDYYPVSCENMQKLETERLDNLVEKLSQCNADEKLSAVIGIISLVRSVSSSTIKEFPIVNTVKCVILDNVKYDLSLREIAEKTGISMYYMMHSFKKEMGITITEYKTQLKIAHAKTMLVNTDQTVTSIALGCGFENSSYFSKLFMRHVHISPTGYRKMMREKINGIPEGFRNIIDKDILLYDMVDHMTLLDRENMTEIYGSEAVKTYAVSLPDDKYSFLHETAIIEYHGKLFSAWYNNEKLELQGRCPIRFAISGDNGKTWSAPEVVADDPSGKILYCPPIFGISDGNLYMMLNQMVSADHMHSLDLYIYNEDKNSFEMLWSRPIPFKLNTNVYTLPNGKLMIPGRVAELDGFPTTPAVLVSDSGRMDSEWRVIKVQENGLLPEGTSYVHPEPSIIIHENKLYLFVRNDLRQFQIVYLSEDLGETWSKPIVHDIHFSNSKTYSGTLSDGRNYIIGNIQPAREKLAMYISEPGTMNFNKCIVLQDGYNKELEYGHVWHYPCAYEYDGKLYVIYTVNIVRDWQKRGAVVSVIDINKI
ncbi:MAG: exo-alpha-sialidase [Clostridia bacterium]|nr:exo-alpha-sialidase [Clostridia bacterium]